MRWKRTFSENQFSHSVLARLPISAARSAYCSRISGIRDASLSGTRIEKEFQSTPSFGCHASETMTQARPIFIDSYNLMLPAPLPRGHRLNLASAIESAYSDQNRSRSAGSPW